MDRDRLTITGHIEWRLEEAGTLIAAGEARNLVTAVGDQMYAERGASSAGAPAAATGMKLGTGATAPAKTGTGAALLNYLTNSHQAFAATYPSSALSSATRQIAYRCTWAAGKATSAVPITEVVLVNETLADTTTEATATVARALLEGANAIPSKTAGSTLTLTWTHSVTGA
jgi:hypothetical protein